MSLSSVSSDIFFSTLGRGSLVIVLLSWLFTFTIHPFSRCPCFVGYHKILIKMEHPCKLFRELAFFLEIELENVEIETTGLLLEDIPHTHPK